MAEDVQEQAEAPRGAPSLQEGNLLELQNVKTYFEFDEGTVRAVDDVSLEIPKGQTLGVVGESGCGKSVTAQSILRIVGSGGDIVAGRILFESAAGVVDIAAMNPKGARIRQIRGAQIGMIFQEPMTSFSPVYTVGKQISEVLDFHGSMSDDEIRGHVVETLGKVGIPKPEQRADAYPFELSGGMRQRAMIAMALACGPRLLIADEPTTALDVTIQAQILELIKSIQRDMGMSIMIISHDMGVIANTADTVAVMYLGEVVEKAAVFELFDNPKHPYTQALLQSIPKVGGNVKGRLESIKGAVPDPYNMPRGCRFHPRCPHYMEGTCEVATPPLFEVGEDHAAACYLYGELQ